MCTGSSPVGGSTVSSSVRLRAPAFQVGCRGFESHLAVNMYIFYYTYQGEIYGVRKYHKERNVLSVTLLRTDEDEDIWDEWLQDQIEKGEIDYSLKKENLT